MQTLWQDLRYGVRLLVRSPGFTATAVLCLALGIGANTAIFSVVDAVLLKPLPYQDPDRLLMLWEKPPGGGNNVVSAANFRDWSDQNRVFEGMAAIATDSFNLSGVEEPENVPGKRVSANFFALLGPKPALGRTFLPEEEQTGKDKVVVLSYNLWQRRFGGDPHLIGKPITLNSRKYTVVGVMSSYFTRDLPAHLWIPLAFETKQPNREFHFLEVLARLKPGVTLGQAQAEMDIIAQSIAQQYPKTNRNWGVTLQPFRDQIVARDLRQSLLVLLGAVGFVLLIGCANVANLMLARGASRQKEVAVRAALGAGRSRLIRQFLTESALLAMVGGSLGFLLAYWLVDLLTAVMPPFTLPSEAEVAVDQRVLLFTLGVSLLTGILFGLAPAWQTTKPHLNESLKEGGRSSTASLGRYRFRSWLVVAEVALALVLLVGAGLLIHSFWRLHQVRPGFRSDKVLTMAMTIPRTKYSQAEQVAAFYRQTLQRVEALAGVERAAVSSTLPLRGWNIGMPFSIEGRAAQAAAELQGALFQIISPGYFQAMGIPLLKGRGLTEQDTSQAPHVAVINQVMVSRFFAKEDPIGKRLMTESLISGREQLGPTVLWEIVGIAGNVKDSGLREQESPAIYVPSAQSPWPFMSLAVRTRTDPVGMVSAVKSAIREVDPDQPVTDVKTMDQIVAESLSQPRFWVMLLGLFAVIAWVLAAVGIYGVLSYSVTERTHEIGIRMALGAERRDVLRLVIGQGMVLILMGVGIGLAGAFGLTRLMSSLLYSVTATDPVTFLVVSLLLTAVACLACYIPARRATKVDPMVALRYE
jgi:putative ABC transport system permease protein